MKCGEKLQQHETERLLGTDSSIWEVSNRIFLLTRAGYGPKNILVQAGVQEGAGPGRGHQSVGEKRVFSSILEGKKQRKN